MRRELFPPEVREFIAANNWGRPAIEITELINAQFGTNYTVEQIKNYRSRNHLISGRTGCFEKGHTPYNKGMRVGRRPGSEATMFKNGNRPHNAVPVGTEIVTRDGYLRRKVAEPNVWQSVHVLNWEAVHGPVPEGSVLIFKDRDTSNCELSNLMLVTRSELARLNKRHLISSDPALTEVGLGIVKLGIATHARRQNKRGGDTRE